MPEDYRSRRVPVSKEDAQRLTRLNEEILGRAAEMSLMLARYLETPPHLGFRKFTWSHPGNETSGKTQVEWWISGDLKACGVYDYDTLECYPVDCDTL